MGHPDVSADDLSGPVKPLSGPIGTWGLTSWLRLRGSAATKALCRLHCSARRGARAAESDSLLMS